MSFDLDTGPTRKAFVLSMPGNTAVVGLTGQGVWSVEVLTTTDGLNYTLVSTRTMPGEWRYDTKTAVAIAIRVSSFTSGTIVGTLTHGGVQPFTYVSPLFGSFLIYSYNATTTEPPSGNQIRFNSTTMTAVTKVWIRNSTVDGNDAYFALRKIPFGGTILIQDRDNHLNAALFRIVNPLVDKVDYVELPVIYNQHTGTLSSAQTLVAVFAPGPTLSLSATELSGVGEPVPQLLENAMLPEDG